MLKENVNLHGEIIKEMNTERGRANVFGSEYYVLQILHHILMAFGEEQFNSVLRSTYEHWRDGVYGAEWKPNFGDIFGAIHKQMRQIDFFYPIGEADEIGGHLDMIFWNAINASETIYNVMKRAVWVEEKEKECAG